MPWMPDIPHDSGAHMGKRSMSPTGVIRHRTYGKWAGDYSVGKNGVGFHFLVGKEEGQWVQFYDTSYVSYHGYGANGTAGQDACIGIEVTGTDVDAFTTWQVRALGRIAKWITESHPIPLLQFESGDLGPVLYSHGPRRPKHFNGWRDHNNVDPLDHPEFRHTHHWRQADWEKVVGSSGGKPPGPPINWPLVFSILQGDPAMPKRITYGKFSHVFNVTQDGRLSHAYYEKGWKKDDPNALGKHPEYRLDPDANIDATTKELGGENEMDVYWRGAGGELGHTWWSGKAWSAELLPQPA